MEIIADTIGLWKNAVSPETCRKFIEVFDGKEQQGIAAYDGELPLPDLYEHNALVWRDNDKRIDVSCSVSNYASFHESRDVVRNLLMETSLQYFKYFQKIPDGREYVPREGWTPHEQPMIYKMQKSYPNGGFCQYHFEQGPDDDTRGRYAVWMLYLNTVEQGGRTEFPNQSVELKPQEGSFLIWPAAFTHPHRATPDLQETKYILTGWFDHPGSLPGLPSEYAPMPSEEDPNTFRSLV